MNGEIHLVTDDDSIDKLIRRRLASLPDEVLLPDGTVAGHAFIERASTIDAERRNLSDGHSPALLILEGSVRVLATDVPSTDGTPAANFLKEIRETNIPVIVVEQAAMEKLEFEALRRSDVAIWRPPPVVNFNELDDTQRRFKEIVQNLGAPVEMRRIDITVGPKSATYRVFDGHYWFTTYRSYGFSWQPGVLIERMKAYSPYVNGTHSTSWQKELALSGRELYGLLMEDLFGIELLETLKQGLDIRFHIDPTQMSSTIAFEDLFLLPFEATNIDERPDSFFCARVPMARRLTGDERDAPLHVGHQVRILLVVGAEGGEVRTISETTGAQYRGRLGFLSHSKEIADYLNQMSNETKQCDVDIDILDETIARDGEFQDILQKKLTTVDYDIVHFYGHSVADPNGTFLFAPGPTPYKARAISVSAVAYWIKDCKIKTKIPYLVFLSSCQSSSSTTALEMMKAGVSTVLGFRWEVEEEAAARFVKEFYKSYLQLRAPITVAYRDACAEVRVVDQGIPGWASAMVFVQGNVSS